MEALQAATAALPNFFSQLFHKRLIASMLDDTGDQQQSWKIVGGNGRARSIDTQTEATITNTASRLPSGAVETRTL